jgi:hypothetical protein
MFVQGSMLDDFSACAACQRRWECAAQDGQHAQMTVFYESCSAYRPAMQFSDAECPCCSCHLLALMAQLACLVHFTGHLLMLRAPSRMQGNLVATASAPSSVQCVNTKKQQQQQHHHYHQQPVAPHPVDEMLQMSAPAPAPAPAVDVMLQMAKAAPAVTAATEAVVAAAAAAGVVATAAVEAAAPEPAGML